MTNHGREPVAADRLCTAWHSAPAIAANPGKNREWWAVNWERRKEEKSMDLLRRLGELAVLAAIICPLFWWFLVTLAEHGW